MRYGTVTQYFPEKGFGFIRPDVGEDVFFHITALGACQEEPDIQPGQAVKYELEPRKFNRDESAAEAKPRAFGEPPVKPTGKKPTEKKQPPQKKPQRRAAMVELIDQLPGGELQDDDTVRAKRHPKARRRKATWRR